MTQWNQEGMSRHEQAACVEDDQEEVHFIRLKMRKKKMGFQDKTEWGLLSQTGSMWLQSNPWSGFHGELLTYNS